MIVIYCCVYINTATEPLLNKNPLNGGRQKTEGRNTGEETNKNLLRQQTQHNALKISVFNIFRGLDGYAEVETRNDGQLSSIMHVCVNKGNKGWCGLRLDDGMEVL